MVERYVRDVEVAGSNPVTPIFLLGSLDKRLPFLLFENNFLFLELFGILFIEKVIV